MMTKTELFVRQIIANELGLEGCNAATLGLRFQEDLNASELQMLMTLCQLEASLAIEVPNAVFHSWRTIGDVVNYLEEHYRIK